MVIPALAQAPVPSQEFWDYLEEYSDANGNVLDPLEFDQITNIKNDDKLAFKETLAANDRASIDKTIGKKTDKTKLRSSDMKFEQKSSAVSSSTTPSAMKGTKL